MREGSSGACGTLFNTKRSCSTKLGCKRPWKQGPDRLRGRHRSRIAQYRALSVCSRTGRVSASSAGLKRPHAALGSVAAKRRPPHCGGGDRRDSKLNEVPRRSNGEGKLRRLRMAWPSRPPCEWAREDASSAHAQSHGHTGHVKKDFCHECLSQLSMRHDHNEHQCADNAVFRTPLPARDALHRRGEGDPLCWRESQDGLGHRAHYRAVGMSEALQTWLAAPWQRHHEVLRAGMHKRRTPRKGMGAHHHEISVELSSPCDSSPPPKN